MNELRVLWILFGFLMAPLLYEAWLCACANQSLGFVSFWIQLIIVSIIGSYFWVLYDIWTPDSDEDEEIEKQLYHDKIISIDGNTITVEYEER